MNLCTQCKYYKPITGMSSANIRESEVTWKPQCLHTNNASVVDGSPKYDLNQLRYGVGGVILEFTCRMIGDWWEAKQ